MNEPLESFLKDHSAITATMSTLHWDQETMMPPNGLKMRQAQLSYLSKANQDVFVSDEFDDALTEFEQQAHSREDDAVVRELRRKQRRQDAVPTELTEKISEAQTGTVEVWREAKKDNEFDEYAEALEKMIELKREYANHINSEKDPYEVLFEDYEPYIEFEEVQRIFDQLKKELPRRLESVKEEDAAIPSPFKGSYDTKTQERVCKALMSDLGLSPDEGRLNLSTHPFTVGSPFEARITTRINENDLQEALSSTVHETGHALYMVGVDEENWWNPLGWDRGTTIHESQSRFWENHVAHRESFQTYLLPILNRQFRGEFEDVTADEAYRAVNKVKEENYIRTEADELTYHLHVLLRFELGQALINGELDVEDLPDAWDEKMEDYLGITPPSLAKGCLQDIHWAQGSFGYFPTYSLGSLAAAQLNEAAEEDLDIDSCIEEERFSEILGWHRDKIHSHGQRLTTQELLRQATGEELGVDAYLDYLDRKLRRVYGVMF